MEIGIFAERTIRKPKGIKTKIKAEYITQDIIKEILELDKKAWQDTQTFSYGLFYKDTEDLLRQLYSFMLNNISYQEDPPGFQFVKTPAVTFKDKFADCKSMSLFAGSVLKNLKIPYWYRFTSYSSIPNYTHVYLMVGKNKEFIFDVVYKKFNQQKPFTFYKDIKTMAGIYRIEGYSNSPTMLNVSGVETEAQMEAEIVRHRLEVEKEIVSGIRGIGSQKVADYQATIDGLNSFINAMNEFNEEKMDAIINKVRKPRAKLFLTKLKHKSLMTPPFPNKNEAVRTARTIQNRMISRRKHIEGLYGIGSQDVADYVNAIGSIGDFITGIQTDNEILVDKALGKIKAPKLKKIKQALQKVKTVAKKVVKKAGADLKKAGKTFVKVATAPQRLAMKGILEVSLPRMAPGFLYLFISDPKVIAKLPAKVKQKRDRQVKFSDFVVNAIGMKRAHFMGILRTGIMKRYKKSPEQVIADLTKGKMAGIGIITDIIEVVLKLVKVIAKVFKKKNAPTFSANDTPDPSDFTSGSDGKSSSSLLDLAKDILTQKDNIPPGNSLDPIVDKQNTATNNSDYTSPGSGGSDENSPGSDGNNADPGQSNSEVSETGGKKLFGIC
jgi:hypothetical protein